MSDSSTGFLTLRTTRLAYKQGCVARGDDGKVVFVSGAAPDELVRVRLLRSLSRYSLATVVEVLEPSPDRVTPRCPLVERCGGCPWQQVSPAAQLAAKQDIVSESLARVRGEVAVSDITPSPRSYDYRSRARLHAALVRGRALVGFFEEGSRTVVPARDCPVLEPELRGLLPGLEQAFQESGCSGELAVNLADPGGLVQVLLENGRGDPRILARSLAGIPGMLGGEVRLRQRPGPRFGELSSHRTLTCRAGTFQIPVSAGGFVQANQGANERLVDLVLDKVSRGDLQPRSILELYAGSGNLTLPLLSLGHRIQAWEYSTSATAALKQWARGNPDLEVRAGDAIKAVQDSGAGKFDCLVMDPPRGGAPEVCKALSHQGPAEIIYVSCDPQTLARDLATLTAQGYRLLEISPVDLFPHTSHVETVAYLSRR